MKPLVLIIMGVSGCGKTTIGALLAQKLQIDFMDADHYHPPENISKMAQGIPLTDADRQQWLTALRGMIKSHLEKKRPMVLACSALRQAYRDYLSMDNPLEIKFIYLQGSFDLIQERMSRRKDHYMKPMMLKSQFETLEEPLTAITVEINAEPHHIVEIILEKLAVDNNQ
jgi:carbohydrate kinase (thermoresistant glucokinase family)